MQHLFSVLDDVLARVSAASRILLLCDFDGTLSPIAARPEMAELPRGVRGLLQSLARQPRCTLGIISGRSLTDVRQRVGVGGIVYAGNHGLEIEGPGISVVHPAAERLKPVLGVTGDLLRHTLAGVPGVVIEDKGLSLSVHYRLVAAESRDDVKQNFERAVSRPQVTGMVRVTHGKAVYEVRPSVAWDKGKAVRLLMKRYGKGGWRSGLFPVYLGDDTTDEDAFRVIAGYGNGVPVYVGEPPPDTAAQCFLTSQAEVEVFLKGVLRQVQANPG